MTRKERERYRQREDRRFRRNRKRADERILPWLPPPSPKGKIAHQLDLFEHQTLRQKRIDEILTLDDYSENRYWESLNSYCSDLQLSRLKSRCWSKLRDQVYMRDGGRCMVCGSWMIGDDKRYWECGHIIDRCVGGPDHLNNLVVMCILCNRLKPLTETRAEYLEWAKKGGPAAEIAEISWSRISEEDRQEIIAKGLSHVELRLKAADVAAFIEEGIPNVKLFT